MLQVPTYADLIGTPFAYGGRGVTLDCFGLVKELHARAGVEIADQDAPDNMAVIERNISAEKARWVRSNPGPGTVVVFWIPDRVTRGLHASHMGLQVSALDFIHTWASTGGVTLESLSEWAHRVEGHYRYAP